MRILLSRQILLNFPLIILSNFQSPQKQLIILGQLFNIYLQFINFSLRKNPNYLFVLFDIRNLLMFGLFQLFFQMMQLTLNMVLNIPMKILNSLVTILYLHPIDQTVKSLQLVPQLSYLPAYPQFYLDRGSLASLNLLKRGLNWTVKPWDFSLILLTLSFR